MKNIRILNFLAILSLVIIGCNPLKKMIELSKDQQINVNPNPMIMKGGSVTFDVESTLPKGMLPKGTSYTLNFTYDGNVEMEIQHQLVWGNLYMQSSM